MRFLLLLTFVAFVNCKTRYKGLSNRPGLQRLLNALVGSDKVRATCDLIFFPQTASFADAKAACRSMGSDLVTLDSPVKNAQLMLLHDTAYPLENEDHSGDTKAAWSGLERVNNKGIKYNANKMRKKSQVKKAYRVSDWAWISNGQSPNEYEGWFSQRTPQPNNEYMKANKAGKLLGCEDKAGCFQDQVVVDQEYGKWDDAFAFEQHPYACDYKGKYILSSERMKWVSAKKACEKAGLVLASVRSAAEVDELQESFEYFLGPAQSEETWDDGNWIWVGGSDAENEGDWRWQDGSVLGWDIPWMPRHGDDNKERNNGEGQHAMAFNRDGQFDDSYGSWNEKQRGFACECA